MKKRSLLLSICLLLVTLSGCEVGSEKNDSGTGGGQKPTEPTNPTDPTTPVVEKKAKILYKNLETHILQSDDYIIYTDETHYKDTVFSQVALNSKAGVALLWDDYTFKVVGVINRTKDYTNKETFFKQSIRDFETNLKQQGAKVDILANYPLINQQGDVTATVYDIQFSNKITLNELRSQLIKPFDNGKVIYLKTGLDNIRDDHFRVFTSHIAIDGKGYVLSTITPLVDYDATKNEFIDLNQAQNIFIK